MATEVQNQDVAGLHKRIIRFREEMIKSGSAGLSEFNSFDQERLMTYIKACRTYIGWAVAQPELDLPESHPRQFPLLEIVPAPEMDNEMVLDVVRLLEVALVEIANSQSARRPAGLVGFDEKRILAVLEKIERYITDYVQAASPLDLPETSPQAALPAQGNRN